VCADDAETSSDTAEHAGTTELGKATPGQHFALRCQPAGWDDRQLSVADSRQAREAEGIADQMGLDMTQFTADIVSTRPGGLHC
jgi:hypothetical protein